MEPRNVRENGGGDPFDAYEPPKEFSRDDVPREEGESELQHLQRCYNHLAALNEYAMQHAKSARSSRAAVWREKEKALDDLETARKEITRLKEDNATLRAEANSQDAVNSAIETHKKGVQNLLNSVNRNINNPRARFLPEPSEACHGLAVAYGNRMQEQVDKEKEAMRQKARRFDRENYVADAPTDFPVAAMRKNSLFTDDEHQQFLRIADISVIDAPFDSIHWSISTPVGRSRRLGYRALQDPSCGV